MTTWDDREEWQDAIMTSVTLQWRRGLNSNYCSRKRGFVFIVSFTTVWCAQTSIEELKLLFRHCGNHQSQQKNRFLSPASSYINREYNQQPFNLNVRSWCKCQTNGFPQPLHQLYRLLSIEWYNYEISHRDTGKPTKCELGQADLAPSHGSKMDITGAV